jgi:hypothetical protein
MNWSRFLGTTFEEASATASFSATTTRWNPDLVANFLGGCGAAAKSFYAQITGVADTHAAFTITVHGIGNWELQSIRATPKDKQFTCGDDDHASVKTPISKTDVAQIQCEKDPNTTLFISIDSSQSDVGPFKILSVSDDLRQKSDDYSKIIDTKIANLNATYTALSQRLNQVDATLSGAVNGISGTVNNVHLECHDIYTPNSGTATCDAGFVATGCSAGYNYGSHQIQNGITCVTDVVPAGQWTRAHCCRVTR